MARTRKSGTIIIGIVWQDHEEYVEVPTNAQAKLIVAEFTEDHEIGDPENYALFTYGGAQLEDYEHVQPAAELRLHKRRPT